MTINKYHTDKDYYGPDMPHKIKMISATRMDCLFSSNWSPGDTTSGCTYAVKDIDITRSTAMHTFISKCVQNISPKDACR